MVLKEKVLVIKSYWESVKMGFLDLVEPLGEALVRLKVNPNVFTTIGFAISVFAGYFFAVGSLRMGAVFVFLSGIVDILDGKVARGSDKVTRFGALYDSTLDRYAEMFIYFGVAYHFIGQDMFISSMASCIALGGSIMVSYVRARAEGLGFSCKVGMIQRPERIIVLGTTALIHVYALSAGIIFLAIMANVTAFHRVYHIYAAENGKKNEVLDREDA
jgi:CDP-diacylglycerol--glycerol-3-phosphate 3-phosphatidyltransferase